MPRGVKLTDYQKQRIHLLRKQGLNQIEIANMLNISHWSVSTTLDEKTLIGKKEYQKLKKIEKEWGSHIKFW